MVPDHFQAFVHRFVAALRADAAVELLTLVEEEALLIGAIGAQLDVSGRAYLRAVLTYASRWRAEGGPHPEESRRERNRSIADEAPRLWRRDCSVEPSYRTIVKPALSDWNDRTTQLLRGGFMQVLLQLPQGVPSTAQEPPRAVDRGRSEKALAREQDILAALPCSEQTAFKTLEELAQRLARKGSPTWDRTTLSRSIRNLRQDGLVDPRRLRRTEMGDRRQQG